MCIISIIVIIILLVKRENATDRYDAFFKY